jgi:GntR family transcriptional regulator/MocR family aminotransferase
MQPRGDATAGSTGPDLLVLLAQSGQGTLRRQLRDALHDAIRSGRLPPGSRLPSSRALAADLGVSRGVAVDAYAQLSAEGFLVSRPGSGTVVADTGGQVLEHTASVQGPAVSGQAPHEIDLRPGPPDLSTFPRATWRVRGVMTNPSLVVVATGATQGITLLAHRLRRRPRVHAAMGCRHTL